MVCRSQEGCESLSRAKSRRSVVSCVYVHRRHSFSIRARQSSFHDLVCMCMSACFGGKDLLCLRGGWAILQNRGMSLHLTQTPGPAAAPVSDARFSHILAGGSGHGATPFFMYVPERSWSPNCHLKSSTRRIERCFGTLSVPVLTETAFV